MVCNTCFEPRHPQDLLRVPRTERVVAWTRHPQYQYESDLDYQIDGRTNADGSTIAGGTVPTEAAPNFVTFGPVDPDTL
jgi:hypothetical protein